MKKLFAVIIAITICISFAGCGNNKNKSENSGLSNRDDIIGAVKSDLVIEGINVPVPFCINDLGDDFSLSPSRVYLPAGNDGSGENLITYLCYQGKSIADIQIYGISEDEKNNENLLNAMMIDYIGAVETYKSNIVFDGVKLGDNINDISKWGAPSEEKEGEGAYIRFTGFDLKNNITGTVTIYPSKSDSGKIGSILLLVK